MTDVYVASGYWGAGYVSEDATFADDAPLEQSRAVTLPQVGASSAGVADPRVGAESVSLTLPSLS